MNFTGMLREKAAAGKPVRVGLIGTGKFGSMILCQARHVEGLQLVGIAELLPDKAFKWLKNCGWPDEQVNAKTLEEAYNTGKTCVIDSSDDLINSPYVDIIIDCTGLPELGLETDLKCIKAGKHIVNVNVEADILAGPIIAKKAREAGVVYSLAYGDQPAIICEMVDWARSVGFEVVCAGKGTRFQPEYHQLTPETFWGPYGIKKEVGLASNMNPKLFCSFIDGTKSAIEMSCVANSTGLDVPTKGGLLFPPCGSDDLPRILKPKANGGVLEKSGMVECVASEERDGRPVFKDIRFGVYVTLHGHSQYMQNCYKEYGMITDETGEFTTLYRQNHMIGLETLYSAVQIGCVGQPTGGPLEFRADVASVAKFDIPKGTVLDGEGGFWVYGEAVPARDSVAHKYLPINFAANKKVLRDIKAGEIVTLNDVEYDKDCTAMKLRREMAALAK